MAVLDWRDWSQGWIKEGQFISFIREGIRYYEFVVGRDWAHWQYNWPETITTVTLSGPYTPATLEITRGYKASTNLNRVWQLIFGIKGEVLIYVELPTDTHRHGIPKQPKPGTANYYVSHFEEWMSDFQEPTFITEHFMMRPDCPQISFEAYNPNAISMTDVKLNIMINKIITERIGIEANGVLTPSRPRFRETLDKLARRAIPQRPITLLPVTAPAEAPSGE